MQKGTGPTDPSPPAAIDPTLAARSALHFFFIACAQRFESNLHVRQIDSVHDIVNVHVEVLAFCLAARFDAHKDEPSASLCRKFAWVAQTEDVDLCTLLKLGESAERVPQWVFFAVDFYHAIVASVTVPVASKVAEYVAVSSVPPDNSKLVQIASADTD